MRVLLVMSDINYSGAPKILIWLANMFSKDGNKVDVLSVYGEPKGQNVESEINIFSFNLVQSSNWFIRNSKDILKMFVQFKKTFKNNQYDIIITFGDTPGIMLLLLKNFFNIRVIVSERGDPFLNQNFRDDFRRRLFTLADGIVFQTEGAQSFFSKRIRKKSIVIPNPVINKDETKYDGIRDNRIVTVGRLDIDQKRQDLLIESFSMIASKYSEVKLVVYGDGPDLISLKKLVQEKKLENRVEFAGVVSNVHETIMSARVFVLTSDYEGIPNALIEAMSVGLPVVSTDCSPGGARLLIDNYENGIIVKRGDVQEVAEGISYILDHPELAEIMGSKASNITKKYSEEKIYKKWNDYVNTNLY